jgi:DNA (cytosine-5)-methyltransferase 1
MRKRYVVPRECARMQSFPDTFMMNADDHVAYKQFGNSVNVEVVRLFAKYMFGDKETRARYSKQ